MKRIVVIAIAFVAAYFVMHSGLIPREHDAGSSTSTTAGDSNQALVAAFENRRSNVQVQGSGQVTKVLSDDNDGSRHQRFIVRVDSGQTVLIAHNIDLANRVASLSNGDRIEFYGEYEWNAKGGVIHWTHRDPQHRHVDGWIKHNGHTYQ
jgi:Protein of unknown function (DUF3465)